MPSTPWNEIRACVFDAYGTLFDVHSAVARLGHRLGAEADRLSGNWRTKQLEYTWLRSLMGVYADFWKVTGDGLDYAMERCGVDDPSLREELMQAYRRLDCYPEVPDTLAAAKRSGRATAILSNGSPAMLGAAVEAAGLAELLDGVYSVDEIGIYKPHPRVYRLACERLGLEASQICFLSSNSWDVAGAAQFGMRVVWVNRFGQTPERLPAGPDAELPDLSGLANLLDGAV